MENRLNIKHVGYFILIILVILIALISYNARDQVSNLQSATTSTDIWDIADAKTIRLKPSEFAQLPKNIVKDLNGRECTIPQAFFPEGKNNVVSGELARQGQTDWAVVCSKNKVSSILVYWNGSVDNPSEIPLDADKNFLVGQGDDKIEFDFKLISYPAQEVARIMKTGFDNVKQNCSEQYVKAYGNLSEPPVIAHDALWAGTEQFAQLSYYDAGEWKSLPNYTCE